MKPIISSTHPVLKLNWKKLSLVEKSSQKHILDNLSGQIKSGEFLTIMGSSGAGKSSFLSLITKTMNSYKSKFISKGKVTLNDKEYTQEDFFTIASYVPQDDLLLEALTVKQTLTFQAELKLFNKTKQQKQETVLKVLKLLNLYEIRESFIGGRQKKSISGGQKKRVAIAIQLISNPACLILDQPTSGLDSSNSLKIIKLLSRLSVQQNKLIIATIHQPSTLIFQQFDKLMLLHKGKPIFLQKASFIVSYMNNLSIKVDQRMNPADFFMLQISKYKEQSFNYKTPMNYQNWEIYKNKNQKSNKDIIISQNDQTKLQFKKKRYAPLTKQIQPLLIRNAKNFLRSPSNQGGKLIQLALFPLFVGVLFFDVLERMPLTTDSITLEIFLRQFVSFLFIGMLFTISQTVYDTILVFPSQKQLIMKQVHSKTYSLTIYYFTKLLVEVPVMLISVLISNSIVYGIVGLKNDFEHWILYRKFLLLFQVFVATAVGTSGYLLGIIVGTLCKNQQYAIQAVPLIMMPMLTYGGQMVNLKNIPSYSSWIQYLTPLRYGFNVIVKSQLQTAQLNYLGDIPIIQQSLGLQGEIKQNSIQLIFLAYGFLVLSFVTLYMRKKFN